MLDKLKTSLFNQLRGKRVVLFWSGGFESTFLLDFFVQNKIQEICELNVIAVTFPQEIYVWEQVDKLKHFGEKNGINFAILTPEETISHDYPYTAACVKCKDIRRRIIVEYLEGNVFNSPKDTVFVTGHNLDDLASYTVELIAKRFDGDCRENRNRFLECSNKFYEAFRYSDTLTLFRPLATYSKKELLKYTHDNKQFEIVDKKCYWSNQRKRTLQGYFDMSGIALSYDKVKQIFLQNFEMAPDEEYRTVPFDTYLM